MKTKQDIYNAALLIKSEIATILANPNLIKYKKFRIELGLIVFTKNCPFAWTNGIFINTYSFPKDKFKKDNLLVRYKFWDEFINQLRVKYFVEKNIIDYIKNIILLADRITKEHVEQAEKQGVLFYL